VNIPNKRVLLAKLSKKQDRIEDVWKQREAVIHAKHPRFHYARGQTRTLIGACSLRPQGLVGYQSVVLCGQRSLANKELGARVSARLANRYRFLFVRWRSLKNITQ